jgi:hypothetical protein
MLPMIFFTSHFQNGVTPSKKFKMLEKKLNFTIVEIELS